MEDVTIAIMGGLAREGSTRFGTMNKVAAIERSFGWPGAWIVAPRFIKTAGRSRTRIQGNNERNATQHGLASQ